ncbi:MAG: M20/M25/M40 family metallo-hydrolase [Planctomycetota bacterium]|jgi:Zn-dependent M28 family amino/carboxypeptidase
MNTTRTLAVISLAALLPACAHSPHSAYRQEVASSPPPIVDHMLSRVSPEALKANVDGLVSFGTRHTLSETGSDTRGIGAARRWILEQFEEYAAQPGHERLTSNLDFHSIEEDGRRITRDVDIANVVAVLPGSMPEATHRHYYILGHYDSRASDPNDSTSDAPGADDDASGVSVLMELARVMSGYHFDATLVFMATAGEEQGLYGARRHAAAAKENGIEIGGVLSNDTVGDPTGVNGRLADREIRVFSEGIPANADERQIRGIRSVGAENDSSSRQLARYIDEVALRHQTHVQPVLMFRPDRFLRGGDHTGFNEQGYPAVRFIEVHESYARQHQDVRTEDGVEYGDLPEFVDGEYMANVARLNLAALAHLANAPSVPGDVRVIAASLSNDTTLRWEASPEPDVAGYEVVWRETWSPVWEHAMDVGDVTEATIDLSKDNWLFGVRAYDQEGYRSPVVFPRAARE